MSQRVSGIKNANADLSNYTYIGVMRVMCARRGTYATKYWRSNNKNYFGGNEILCKGIEQRKEPVRDRYHDSLDRTVINPGTDLTFSRATGL